MSEGVLTALISAISGFLIATVPIYMNLRKSREDTKSAQAKLIERNDKHQKENRQMITELNSTVSGMTTALCRMEAGQKALLRHDMEEKHAIYTSRGAITGQQLRDFEEEYDIYHQEGGNGTVTRLLRDVRQLPIHEDVMEIEKLELRS